MGSIPPAVQLQSVVNLVQQKDMPLAKIPVFIYYADIILKTYTAPSFITGEETCNDVPSLSVDTYVIVNTEENSPNTGEPVIVMFPFNSTLH
ncbi:hypothetical protein DDB_G0272915 [Dictyostelium discoideum AX4]|uniref:Uncharacterized protein n=1 Tax=Dictyostelium discoideum TaxID=44689 RepID=Q559E0_DICDI|nr:hypothetical protein DDB_G0272915 [Dictyostelium discoideum AX4]EAL71095.1 hypothetical protein DDB_G0272915 [Dictyostelium discoideum AX4]|eukprot:XP_644876.1 hypothetical protein DDB_G0272915 [Dictyostelium discoideum AX4]